MPLRLIHKHTLVGPGRHVRNAMYETHRFLLEEDGLGVTVTDILLRPGEQATYGYDRHVEIAYCIEGDAIIRDLGGSGGDAQRIGPGTMWIAEKGDRFSFEAIEPTRLICVFTPPFRGDETGFAGDQ